MNPEPSGPTSAPVKRRRLRRALLIVAGVVVVALVAAYQICPYRGTWPDTGEQLPLDAHLTRAEALSDIDFAYASLRDRHMSTVDGVPAVLQERYEEVREALPAEPTVLDVWRAVSRLANAVGDAHTGVIASGGRVTTVGFQFDGTRLTLDEPGEPEVLALNGVAVADLWQAHLDLASYERPDAASASFVKDLRFTDRLQVLGGPASDTVVATLSTGTRELPTVDWASARSGESHEPVVTFEGDTAVLTLNECEPGPEYTAALDTLFDGVSARGIDRVVVDLRDNGGGDSAVANEFIGRLDVSSYDAGGAKQRWGPFVFGSDSDIVTQERTADPYRGRVWVLTSARTFSSAVIFTRLLQDNGLATVVGQSPSNNPNAYGDVVELRLPASGLIWQTTYKLFTRANGDTDPSHALVPDIVTAPGEEMTAVEQDR